MEHSILDRKVLAVTLLLVFLLANMKVNVLPVFLLLFFITPSQFTSRKSMAVFWSLVVLILIVVAGGWNWIAWQSDAVRRGLEGISPFSLAMENLRKPLAFLQGLAAYIWQTGAVVLKNWVASTGYNYWPVHWLVSPFWLLALAAAMAGSIGERKLSRPIRLGLVGGFFLLAVGTFALRYILLESIDNPVSVSGRYFTAFSPLLFLGLAGWGRQKLTSIRLNSTAAVLTAVCLAFFSYGLWVAYYQVCGAAKISRQACVLPVYKNWNPSQKYSLPVVDGLVLSQGFEPQCQTIRAVRLFAFYDDGFGDLNNVTGTFTLVDASDGSVLAEESFDHFQVSGDYLEFPLAQLPQVGNRRLVFNLRIGQANTGVALATTQGDQYRGALTLSGEVMADDLLLKYLCGD